MRILVRAPNWIGDQVLAYPFFHRLRSAYPQAKITSVCVPWVEDVQFRDLVDDTYVLPRPMLGTWREKLDNLELAARELKARGQWDLGISLPNSLSAGWLLYRSGVKTRRGYSADGRGLLLNDRVRWSPDPNRHRAQAYADLLPEGARLTVPARDFWGKPPEDELDERVPGVLESFDALKSWKTASDAIEPPAGPYWVLAPGATAESRRWPPEMFQALARKIAAETGWTGVVVGGPKEAVIAQELCSDSDSRLIDRTAQGPVPGLWRLFRQAKVTVSNESGLAHVASLCGSPVQIVCGAADPRRTRPIGPGKVQVAVNPVECWPCERNTCSQPPGRQLLCLRGISPETVFDEVKRASRSAL